MTDFEMFRTVFKKIDPNNDFSAYVECSSRTALEERLGGNKAILDLDEEPFTQVDKYIRITWGVESDGRSMYFDKSGEFLFAD